ncbi:DUF2071 domain-containing protein [halophilic archaeon]|nr:DUF2071 domain-containing protein [halophilic archaeon]
MLPSLHLDWRHVLFANWSVDPELVARKVPDALDVQTRDGQAWLSVVPFTNVNVRPRLTPKRLGRRLPELNLRTYVTFDGEPGIYFFSLDADGVLSVLGARLFHHLPYYFADIDLSVADGQVRFESRRRHPGSRPVRVSATYRPTGERFRSEPGSLAEFLTERHCLFTEAQDGSIRYTTVAHERWPLYDAEATVDAEDLFRANGFDRPAGDAVFYYSPGVDTLASPSRRLE